MINIVSNQQWVTKTPIITVVLLEAANIQQIFRMWTERTAAGQSLWAWSCVNIALWLWWNYYRVMLPQEKIPRRTTMLGICLNSTVILSVIWFRYMI